MKTIDTKSLLIGFLLASCMFLFMGLTDVSIKQSYSDVLKVELVKPTSLFGNNMEVDVNIKDFPYEKLKVDIDKY